MLETPVRCWSEVDYSAIKHNVDEIQKLVGKTKIMGIVKANAYGHGSVPVAKALREAGVDFFAVALIDEAIELREAGIEEDILILGWTAPIHFDKLVKYNLIQTLASRDYAKELDSYGKEHGVKMRAHAKVDTGMNRIGVPYQEGNKHLDQLIEEYGMENLNVEGIFSHFPVSDDLGEDAKSFTKKQIELFEEALDGIRKAGFDPGIRHIQNSYGILNYMDLGYDYCRPGLLYMGVTSDDSVEIASNPDFIPILSWKTNVTYVRKVPAGATIGYGRTYKLDKDAMIASVAVGYADGLSRSISNKGFEVLVHGQRAKQVGRICMDQMMIDVTGIDGVKGGDEVVLVGKQGNDRVTVDTISRLANTINNETLSNIGARVPRLSKGDF